MTALLIEKSVRLALRYLVNGKLISTEDLWKSKLEDLDVSFKELTKLLREQVEESLLETKSNVVTVIELKRDIIKYVVATLKEEAAAIKEAQVKAANNAEIKQVVLESLRDDKIAELKALSKEERLKLLSELG